MSVTTQSQLAGGDASREIGVTTEGVDREEIGTARAHGDRPNGTHALSQVGYYLTQNRGGRPRQPITVVYRIICHKIFNLGRNVVRQRGAVENVRSELLLPRCTARQPWAWLTAGARLGPRRL